MKTLSITLAVLVLPGLSLGQEIRLEDLAGKAAGALISKAGADSEAKKLHRASEKYNLAQPKFAFGGATVEVRVVDDQWGYGNWENSQKWQLRQAIAQKLHDVGAVSTWDRKEIEGESEDRDAYEANRHVKKPAWLGRPTIELADFQLDLSLVMIDKSEDAEINFGSLWRGVSLRFGRQSAYAGIVCRITDRRRGTSKWIYKVLEVASSADNVGANLAGGFFGDNFGGSYESDPTEANRLKAREKAVEELGAVFANRNGSNKS